MAIKAADQISIVDVTDAYSVILTSEAYTFIGNTTGAPSGLTCTTQAVAYCGTNQCTSVSVTQNAITCPSGISATVSGNGTSAVTITFTTTATVSTACEATIPVVVDGITVNKKFSFAVAKTGATGSKGDTGAAGKGVSSTEIKYQASNSGTTVPTGTWQTEIPSVSASNYLWTRTVITYTDSTTSTSYSVGMMGATGSKGDTGATGKGVSSTEIKYQASSSGTVAPTGTWQTTIPSLTAGQYLWTRTVITYSDSTTSTSYSVGMKGATGAKGDTGDAGEDAITVSVTSSNGTVLKNNAGSTVLTAHVFVGGIEKTVNASTGVVADGLGTIKWYQVSSGTETLKKTAGTITVGASSGSGIDVVVTTVAAITCKLEG